MWTGGHAVRNYIHFRHVTRCEHYLHWVLFHETIVKSVAADLRNASRTRLMLQDKGSIIRFQFAEGACPQIPFKMDRVCGTHRCCCHLM